MKRVLAVLCFFLFALSVVSASFVFDFGPSDPLYAPSLNDSYTFYSGLHYIHQTESSPEGNNIMVMWKAREATDPDKFEVISYRDGTINDFLHLQLGTSVSFFRIGWPEYFLLSPTLQASFNSVFAASGGADVLGFDGSFFFGGEARILDGFVMRFGLRHYSGHTGDEVLQDAVSRNVTDSTGSFEVVNYVRDNMYELGIGYDGNQYVQVFASILLPKKSSWWNPVFHKPDWIESLPGKPTSVRDEAYWNARGGGLGSGYGAYILQGDLNLAYPFSEKYKVFSSLNVKFHQDGTTNHTLTLDDDTVRWEMEWTASLGFTISDAAANKALSIEVLYHDGRFPLLNYFWKRSKYVSVGIAIR